MGYKKATENNKLGHHKHGKILNQCADTHLLLCFPQVRP